MMKGITGAVTAVILLLSGSAYSAPILFEFSGRFGDCQAPCDDAELAALGQQEYSGSLLIPSSASELEPDSQSRPFSYRPDMIWSYYELLGPQAEMNFDTVGSTFDVAGGSPINTIVSFCGTSSCPSNENFVWFQFIGETYTFTLNFGALPNIADRSTNIPSIDIYPAFFYVGFDVHRNDDYTNISTNLISPDEMEMEISISHLNVEPAQVPIGGVSSILLSLIVGVCGLQGLRGKGSKIMTGDWQSGYLRSTAWATLKDKNWEGCCLGDKSIKSNPRAMLAKTLFNLTHFKLPPLAFVLIFICDLAKGGTVVSHLPLVEPLVLDTDFSELGGTLENRVIPGNRYIDFGLTFHEFGQEDPSLGITSVTYTAPVQFVSINFETPYETVLLEIGGIHPILIEAALNGVPVTSVLTAGGGIASRQYYGFSGEEFDEIRFYHLNAGELPFDERFFAVYRLQLADVAVNFGSTPGITRVPMLPALASIILMGLLCYKSGVFRRLRKRRVV